MAGAATIFGMVERVCWCTRHRYLTQFSTVNVVTGWRVHRVHIIMVKTV